MWISQSPSGKWICQYVYKQAALYTHLYICMYIGYCRDEETYRSLAFMVIEANTWHLFIDTSINTFMVDESWIKYAQL